MLKAIETENVIKNIITEIIRECGFKGVKTSASLAAFVIKLTVINPEYGFIEEQHRPIKREDVERLVSLCVAKLCEAHSPSLASMKMQVYFQQHYASRDVLLDQHRANMAARVAPLIAEIKEVPEAIPADEQEKLFRKLVVATILISELGNSSEPAVLKEATVATQSVFPPEDMQEFLQMSRAEREAEVEELTQIVTGIRLFNRDCKRGGEGIDDLPDLLEKAVVTTNDTLQSSLQKLMKRVNVLTAAVESIVASTSERLHTAPPPVADPSHEFSAEVDEEKVELAEEIEFTQDQELLVIDTLGAGRLMEVNLRKLLADLDIIDYDFKEQVEHLHIRLAHIHDTLKFRTAIPTQDVFPQFIALSEIWTKLQDTMVLVGVINNVAWHLQSYNQVVESVANSMKRLIGHTAITDAERLEASVNTQLESDEMLCRFISPSMISNIDDVPLEYLGFCAWALVVGQGALIPANPNMGICEWNDKYYAFSTVHAGTEWGNDPDKFIMDALTIVRKKPELIGLLQLQDEVDAIKDSVTVEPQHVVPQSAVKETNDRAAQTVWHPVSKFIDTKYTWNQWDLKRQALQLANILKCKTHSTQTMCSNFRASVGVQAEPGKSKEGQTRRDNMTNTPKMQDFFFGLRGRKDGHPHQLLLTRPVDQ